MISPGPALAFVVGKLELILSIADPAKLTVRLGDFRSAPRIPTGSIGVVSADQPLVGALDVIPVRIRG